MTEFNRCYLVKEMNEWLGQQRWLLHDQMIRGIQGLLKSRNTISEHEKAVIGADLDLLCSYVGTEALSRICRGDTSGWSALRRSLHLSYWAIRIRTRRWETNTRRTKRPSVLLDEVALCLSLAMALRDAEVTSWLGERMRLSLADGAFVRWELAQFPAFILGLFDMSQRRERSVEIADVSEEAEPYSGIFEAWNDQASLRNAIVAMCEYHLSRTEETDEYNPEFCTYPFSIFPAEVHALRNVRHKLGLKMPQVEHPLLEVPFDHVPRDIPAPPDPLLDAVKVYG